MGPIPWGGGEGGGRAWCICTHRNLWTSAPRKPRQVMASPRDNNSMVRVSNELITNSGDLNSIVEATHPQMSKCIATVDMAIQFMYDLICIYIYIIIVCTSVILCVCMYVCNVVQCSAM